MSKEKSRIGEIRIMNCGEKCEIVEYNGVRDVTVKFLKTGELVKSTYNEFKKGSIKSHFTPTVYGVGIVGLERTKENGKQLKSYETWSGMLRRCYDEMYKGKHPTYKDCSVCEEWLYYSNFKQWYSKNYYEVDNEKMCLDKDILFKGNKVYSPDMCMFVPHNINSLFTKSDAKRNDLPIGVTWYKNKYKASCNIFDLKTNISKSKHLGYHNTPEEAFSVYKIVKEENVKLVADYYREQIPKRLYDTMYSYEVHIDD